MKLQNKIKLIKKEKECVKKWLKKEKLYCCFEDIISYCEGGCEGGKKGHRICKSWFPKIINNPYKCCPCDNYKLSTVISRARKMIK